MPLTLLRHTFPHASIRPTVFSTERGDIGCANAPYDGFNINPYCGDSPAHTATCLNELCHELGIDRQHIVLPHQVHGTRVVQVCEKTLPHLPHLIDGADALFTNLPGYCLCISTADCIPLFFLDNVHHAIAAVHAGWRGTVARIGVSTLTAMNEAFGTCPEDVSCIIGPGISGKAFEVGDEVYEAFQHAGFPMLQISFRQPSTVGGEDERWHIDLWRANTWQLESNGVPPSHIHVTGICTYSQYHRFFSARRLSINSGRILNGIFL